MPPWLLTLLPTLAPSVIDAVIATIRGHPDTTDAQRAATDAAFDALASKPDTE